MKRSLGHGGGYLTIDHRDSPGLTPADVAHVPGAIAVPGGQQFESDAFVCCHCQTVVVKNPGRTRPRGYCAKCDHVICDNPICNRECRPIAQIFDRLQDHAERFVGREDHPEASPLVILTDKE